MKKLGFHQNLVLPSWFFLVSYFLGLSDSCCPMLMDWSVYITHIECLCICWCPFWLFGFYWFVCWFLTVWEAVARTGDSQKWQTFFGVARGNSWITFSDHNNKGHYWLAGQEHIPERYVVERPCDHDADEIFGCIPSQTPASDQGWPFASNLPWSYGKFECLHGRPIHAGRLFVTGCGMWSWL